MVYVPPHSLALVVLGCKEAPSSEGFRVLGPSTGKQVSPVSQNTGAPSPGSVGGGICIGTRKPKFWSLLSP